jgi:hypothetical protein
MFTHVALNVGWSSACCFLDFDRFWLEFSLPGIAFLEGKDQNDPAEEAGEADEFLCFDRDMPVHKQDLPEYQADREGDDHDTAHSAFGGAFEESENGDQRKEQADEGCHRRIVFDGQMIKI